MDVVLLGPPGAGKGTQAAMLAKQTGLCHISSGDLFRKTMQSGSELGRLIASYYDAGKLVPDDITVRMVTERLQHPDCAAGAILDGFPRTSEQARALDAALAAHGRRVDRAVCIQVPQEVLVRRLSSRWLSRKTGESFNVETLGQSLEAIRARLDPDDELYQRSDDTAEAARVRIAEYEQKTMPLVEYYRRQGVLREVDGNQPIEAVLRDLLHALDTATDGAARGG